MSSDFVSSVSSPSSRSPYEFELPSPLKFIYKVERILKQDSQIVVLLGSNGTIQNKNDFSDNSQLPSKALMPMLRTDGGIKNDNFSMDTKNFTLPPRPPSLKYEHFEDISTAEEASMYNQTHIIKLFCNYQRFTNEVEVLQRLQHPNIVRLIDQYKPLTKFDTITGNKSNSSSYESTESNKAEDEAEFRYFIVLEYISEGRLLEMILSETVYNEQKARSYMLDILRAVKYMHDREIIHRNINPANILINVKDGEESLKLIGFGCADEGHGFQFNDTVGTPEFMAPEIIEKKPYGKPVDMWSIGVTLYFLLSGAPPFHHDDPVLLNDSIINGDCDFNSPVWSTISDDAIHLIQRLLTYNPHNRLTVQQALDHPWMNKSILFTKEIKEVYRRRKSFRIIGKFKSCVKKVIQTNRILKVWRNSRNGTPQSIHSRYEFIKPLGMGGFSVVWLGQNKLDQFYVAIKELSCDKMIEFDIQCVYQEVRFLRAFQHPNIVTFYDFIKEENKFYLVMEYMEGGELLDLIKQKIKFNEKEARDIAYVILITIQYLHERNVVHRDLKPENLLLSSSDEHAIVKLADFGSAINIELGVGDSYCGTAEYMAPEIITATTYGKPVDMWACGVIMFILLCGSPPFQHEKKIKLFKLIMSGKYHFDPIRWSNVSDEAKDFVKKLLEIDPEKRLNVNQALEHSWMNRRPKELINNIIQDNLIELKRFHAHSKFRSSVRKIMAINRFKMIWRDKKYQNKVEVNESQSNEEMKSSSVNIINSLEEVKMSAYHDG